MPGFDGTGPNGLGPRSGRGMGRCNETQTSDGWYGRGMGRRGMGRGRYCQVAPLANQDRLAILKEEKRRLEEEIAALEK
jgi:hypothetical protein